jgi:hypothetical protein
MPFANVVLNGAAMIAVWVTISGFGVVAIATVTRL